VAQYWVAILWLRTVGLYVVVIYSNVKGNVCSSNSHTISPINVQYYGITFRLYTDEIIIIYFPAIIVIVVQHDYLCIVRMMESAKSSRRSAMILTLKNIGRWVRDFMFYLSLSLSLSTDTTNRRLLRRAR